MTVLLNIILVILIYFIFVYSIIDPGVAVGLSIFLLIGDFRVTVVDIEFIAKALVIYSTICCYLKYKVKKDDKLLLLLLMAIIFVISLIKVENTSSATYNFFAFITSYANILMGILLIYINWPDLTRIKVLKILAWTPIITVLLGILDKGNIFLWGRLVSLGLFSHLPFWCGAGFIAAITLWKMEESPNFELLALLDIMLIFFTRYRGGAIYAVILLLPYIFEKMRELKRSFFIKVVVISPLLIYFFYQVALTLLERTFTENGINSTNRFEAWKKLLELSEQHRLFGMGIGYIKSITGEYIISQGFNAAHNEYIRFIVETGILGMIIFGIIMFVVFKKYIQLNLIIQNSYILAPIIGFLIYGITDNVVSAAQSWGPFMLLISLRIEDGCIYYDEEVDRLWRS